MNDKTSKPVAKSLHTITVLQQVATNKQIGLSISNADAIDLAMSILGLAGRDDPYKLRDAALRQMNKAAELAAR